jgi:hypothetical protein
MSAGGSALAIAVIVLFFVMMALWSKRERDTVADRRKHHDRLMEEIRRQPWTEVDEYE